MGPAAQRGAGIRAVSKFSDILLTLRLEKTGVGLRVTALAFGDRNSDGLVLALTADLGERLVRRLLGQPFFHDLILRGGTADSLAVPAGSRLRAFRNVGPFHGYVAPPVDGRPSLLWKSYGDWVRFIPDDGNWIMLHWREIDDSLTGSASP